MLSDADMGELFSQMQAAYGHSWAHKANSMPMWKKALGGFSRGDVLSAVLKATKTYQDFPPTLGQFTDLVEYNTPMLEGPEGGAHDNMAKAERIYAYTMPHNERKNPAGNPHKLKLPESIAQRKVGEHVDDYEKRISNEMTFALYTRLRAPY